VADFFSKLHASIHASFVREQWMRSSHNSPSSIL